MPADSSSRWDSHRHFTALNAEAGAGPSAEVLAQGEESRTLLMPLLGGSLQRNRAPMLHVSNVCRSV